MVIKVYYSGISASPEVGRIENTHARLRIEAGKSCKFGNSVLQLILNSAFLPLQKYARKQVRSYQQRSQFILDSLRVDYESIDVTDPAHEDAKGMIKEKCKHRNGQPPKTPQFFNDDVYCGVISHHF